MQRKANLILKNKNFEKRRNLINEEIKMQLENKLLAKYRDQKPSNPHLKERFSANLEIKKNYNELNQKLYLWREQRQKEKFLADFSDPGVISMMNLQNDNLDEDESHVYRQQPQKDKLDAYVHNLNR